MSLAVVMPEQERTDALIAFQRRSVAIGNSVSPGRNWRTDICASLAGSFAIAINGRKRLTPGHLLTDRECAVVWIDIVATDAATQKIGEDLDRALLATPTWLFEARAIERGSQFVGEVRAIHDRIASGPASGLVTGIAHAFLDWALLNDSRGVEVLEQYMEDTVALVSRQRG